LNRYSDILVVPKFGDICISERLKNEMESNDISGFEYLEPNYYQLTFDDYNIS
jgi:hypothetical protein